MILKMKSVTNLLASSLACLLLASGMAHAQFGREAVWSTAGSNAQRSAWVKTDGEISKDKLAPDFQFLWKVQLDKPGMTAPTQPIVMERYIGYRGFRALAFMTSIAGGVYAVDTDLNRIEWQKHIAPADQNQSTSNCAASISASITLPVNTDLPSSSASFGFGRGGAAKSGVGEPFQGAVTLAALPPQPPPPPPAQPAAAATPAPAPAPLGPPRTRMPIVLYTVTSDGMFHELYVSNGDESEPPVKFVPPSSIARGLIIVDKVAYAVAGQGCGAPDQLLALDLATKQVLSWTADGAVIGGSEGAAIGPNGTLYVATGKGNSTYASSVVALDAKTLKPRDWYSASGQDFTSTPVIFQYKTKVMVAASTRDGRLHILNASSLGGADHKTPVAVAAGSGEVKDFVPGALATWQDSALTRWLLASTASKNGLVEAWKLVDDEHGLPTLQPGWLSQKISLASTPLVINGVVFTASNALSEKPQASASVLYALDGTTGKDLWSSKDAIHASAAAVSAGAGHVYVTTDDGALYAFGFPMEH